MKPARFAYHGPTTVEEALQILAVHSEDAKVLAGGQSIVPMLAMRLTRFDHLIDLNRVAELSSIDVVDGWLRIGAMTRQAVAERSAAVAGAAPLVARAIPKIGHFQIRNRGTVGGSIAHADPASELPAVATCLGAKIEVRSAGGIRLIDATDFFISVWETVLEPDEILTAVLFPVAAPHSGFAIDEVAWRSGDFAIAGAACAVALDADGRIAQVGLSMMGMSPTPERAGDAEAALVGQRPEEIDLDAVAASVVATTSPLSDVHAPASYRKTVGRVLVKRVLANACTEATHG
jgi:carbon-monoxide dehydrogenase medium subunit